MVSATGWRGLEATRLRCYIEERTQKGLDRLRSGAIEMVTPEEELIGVGE